MGLKHKHKIQILNSGSLIVLLFLLIGCGNDQVGKQISLAGNWKVKLDSLNKGESEHWAADKFMGTAIELPGTLDDAGMGRPDTLTPALNNYVLASLTRKHHYTGKAWYQKEIEVPDTWKGEKIRLTLERVIWESKVFVDGQPAGSANSLVGSHNYDLSALLKPGKHLLTVVIDNSNKFPLINREAKKYPDPAKWDLAHAYTNHTQIKWNGIIGDIKLTASGKEAPHDLQVYPELEKSSLKVTFVAPNTENKKFQFQIVDKNKHTIYTQKVNGKSETDHQLSFAIKKPKKLKTWDEFHPTIYTAQLINGQDTLKTQFGYKEITNKNGVLTLNGHRIFLRGDLNCVIFPLTGYPPMHKKAWAKLIEKAKSYGLNHFRFHSWCPPEAAFEAADEAGFYYQVELPHWSLQVGKEQKTTDFLDHEAYKILKDYGNHPSFILMSMGNELEGNMAVLNERIARLKKKDNRHLYTTTTFSFQKPVGLRPEPEDQFFVTQYTKKGWVRGQGIFNSEPPRFDQDYTANSEQIDVPLISHEIGQYAVYPDLSEIPEYTGVLKPLNFIAIKNDLEQKGLLDLAPAFTHFSGKLAAMLYKEEIERALKTPDFDGFQLLQLQDYPGQGTALVGLLNAFWKSKGIISAEKLHQFNGPVVPLVRFKKAVYQTGETFRASIEIANFYKKMDDETIEFNIQGTDGREVTKGEFRNTDLSIGNNKNLGEITVGVNVKKAKQLILTVGLKGTDYKNEWPIWVYPKKLSVPTKNIVETSSFKTAIKALQQGKKVFLTPDLDQIKGVKGQFVPVFWSPVHFPDHPGTMGLLVDKDNEAFAHFPTRSYTQWQWWDLCNHSKSVQLDALKIKPLVRVIDNFVTNRNLATIFEAKVEKGKLLFSSMNLHSDLNKRPVARQLRYSLLNYMTSNDFNPSEKIDVEFLSSLQAE